MVERVMGRKYGEMNSDVLEYIHITNGVVLVVPGVWLRQVL